jgi:hypothetical protein
VVVRAAIAPPLALAGERAQRRPQRLIVAGDDGVAPLRRAVLIDIPARPALADAEAVAQHRDRLAPTGRAHQFPFATSLSASMFSA